MELDKGDPAKMRWRHKYKVQKKITMHDEEKMRHLYEQYFDPVFMTKIKGGSMNKDGHLSIY